MAAKSGNVDSLAPQLALSHEKLRVLAPELYLPRSWTKFLRENGYRLGSPNEDVEYWKQHLVEHLRTGDPRPAIVMTTKPLLVAAYAEELDCIAMLRFDARLTARYGLGIGTRLLAMNSYLEWNFWLPEDLRLGPRARDKYRNVAPLIADFLADDPDAVARRKAAIPEREWKRADALGREYYAAQGEKARDGRPLLCHLPAKK